MKKKQLLFIAAAAAMLAACAKTEAPVEELTPENSPAETKAAQSVIFGTNLKANEETKATVTAWAGQDLYVIGFADAKLASASGEVSGLTENDGFLIPNAKGSAPASGTSGQMKLIHGTQSDGTTEEPYYYNEQVESYSFCAYYVDDAEENPSPVVEDSKIILKDLEIDGCQDILAAVTDADRKNADRVIPSGNDAGKHVNTKYVYSAYSSRKGIKPTLEFNHMLSRFVFSVKVGGTDAATIAPKITIDSLKFDTYAKGDLQLYPETKITKATTDTTGLYLLELPTTLSNEYVSDFKQICDAIMVIPGETEYIMHLYYKQDGIELAGNNGVVAYDIPITIADVTSVKDPAEEVGSTFLAGKQYNVNIVIYGLEEVKINVTLSEWDPWGQFEYDPDEKGDGIED